MRLTSIWVAYTRGVASVIVVATTASGGLKDVVIPQFGRARTFTFVEISNGEIVSVEVLQNPAFEMPSGAGVRAAQLVIDKGAKVVITGNVGMKAMDVLKKAGIKIYDGAGLTVEDAIRKFIRGELEEITVARGGGWR